MSPVMGGAPYCATVDHGCFWKAMLPHPRHCPHRPRPRPQPWPWYPVFTAGVHGAGGPAFIWYAVVRGRIPGGGTAIYWGITMLAVYCCCGISAGWNADRGGSCGYCTVYASTANCCCVASSACRSSFINAMISKMLLTIAFVLALFANCIWEMELALDPKLLSPFNIVAAPW